MLREDIQRDYERDILDKNFAILELTTVKIYLNSNFQCVCRENVFTKSNETNTERLSCH